MQRRALGALYKDYASSTLMAASYKIATTSGAVTETYTAAGASSDWVIAMAAFRPATTTTGTASTTSATTTLSYDNNGNLTGEGSSTFSWDYRNQMTQSGSGLATSTYAYDQDGNRVKLTEGSVTTFFPNALYSVVTGATTTKNIFANGMLISTIESASSTSSGGGGGIAASTPAFVQSKKDSATGSVTLTNPVTTGNFIVVGVTIWNTAIPSNAITDSKGNTYTKVGEVINATTLDHGAIFYAKNVTGGSSFTVTSSVGGTIAAHEYSGITVSNPFDKVASSTGFSTVPNSTSITTGNDHDLYFGLAWSNTTGDAWSAAGGYTLRENETNNNTAERIGTEDQVISTASTTAALFSLPNATDWVAMIASFKPATTSSGGGGGSTASTTVRYVANDNISGSSIVMDASSSVVEVEDFYPYGGIRMDTKTNYGGVRNKYAGTVYDALSGLNYMQARYQTASRGQFISEDPVFWSSQQNLGDPQSLNSYSYANDNPTTNSDPTGRTYLELSAAGTFQGWSGSIGVRADLYGINVFAAGGAGVGSAGYPISLALSSGNLSRKTETTMTAGGDAAYLFGLGVSGSGTYQPSTYSVTNKSGDVSLIAGYGADAYLRKEISTPVLGGLPPDGLVYGKASNFSSPNYVVAPRPSVYMSSNSRSLTMYRGQSPNSFSIPGVSSQSSRQSPSGGGNAVSTWMGAFNPFSPH